MFSRRNLIILVVVLLLAAGGGAYYWQQRLAAERAAQAAIDAARGRARQAGAWPADQPGPRASAILLAHDSWSDQS